MAIDADGPYRNIIKKQKEVITRLELFKIKPDKSVEEFKEIYSDIVSMAEKEGNDFIPAV